MHCKFCGNSLSKDDLDMAMLSFNSDATGFIAELRCRDQKLSAKDEDLRNCKEELKQQKLEFTKLTEKYERLSETYKRSQRKCQSLEQHTLSLVEKFENDRTRLQKDLNVVTSKLLAARQHIRDLQDLLIQYRQDCALATSLLQSNPSQFLAPRLSFLPSFIKERVIDHCSVADVGQPRHHLQDVGTVESSQEIPDVYQPVTCGNVVRLPVAKFPSTDLARSSSAPSFQLLDDNRNVSQLSPLESIPDEPPSLREAIELGLLDDMEIPVDKIAQVIIASMDADGPDGNVAHNNGHHNDDDDDNDGGSFIRIGRTCVDRRQLWSRTFFCPVCLGERTLRSVHVQTDL